MRLQRLMVPFGPPSASCSLPSRSCHVTQSFILEMMVRTTKNSLDCQLFFYLYALRSRDKIGGFPGGNLDLPASERLGR